MNQQTEREHRMAEREHRMALSAVFDGGEPRLTTALAETEPGQLWAQALAGTFGAATQRRAASLDLTGLLTGARRTGIRFVMPGDDEWPTALEDLNAVPEVSGRGGVPVGLWLKGPGHLGEWVEQAVSIVGSRTATGYGANAAADLAAEVAVEGWTVVSGGAMGIDGAAHRGAIEAAGRTIAVVACGPDVDYPRDNAQILHTIATDHLIVSEFPPGLRPARIRFLSRNRLIAALAAGSVVVQGRIRSGSKNTMAWAEALQRICMAVPGPITLAESYTPNQWLREHRAELVGNGAEILELVGRHGDHLLSIPREPENLLDQLTEPLRSVFEALPARGYRSPGELSVVAGAPVPSCLAALAALEAQGLAEPYDGGWRAIPPRR